MILRIPRTAMPRFTSMSREIDVQRERVLWTANFGCRHELRSTLS